MSELRGLDKKRIAIRMLLAILLFCIAIPFTGCINGCFGNGKTTPSPSVSPITPTPMITSTPSPSPIPLESIDASDVFTPSGWWGDYGDISLDTTSRVNPHSGTTCIEIKYSAAASQGYKWSAICWQYPPNNNGNIADGKNLAGYKKLTFWARGKDGGEKAEFKIGGTTGNYPDSIQPAVTTGTVTLNKEWKKYTIDISGKDLSHVIAGFIWATSKDKNPDGCTIYLDDIRIEP